MRFYNRENELALLDKVLKASNESAKMTFIVGRRRIGKTELIKKAYGDKEFIYLFVSKKNEALLCDEFIGTIEAESDIKVFGEFSRFRDLFAYLVEVSKNKAFTLAIDEFQEFFHINKSIYSDIQNIWDANKKTARLNLVFSGSVFALMKEIFENSKEPLFGRSDSKIHLQPFTASCLIEILNECYPAYKAEELLALYTITGGVPKYVELFVNQQIFTFDDMLDCIFSPNSLFLDEGKTLLIEEFGKEYGNYFSILSLIAASKTSRRDIESIMEKDIGGYLERLEKDYSLIKKVKPIFAKPGGRTQKYYINDNFLNFWFRYIFKYSSTIEIGNFEELKKYVRRDFSTYSGLFLEKFLRGKLAATGEYTQIGNYWERGNQNELDIVAVNEFSHKALIAEVKLKENKLNMNKLRYKARALEKKLSGFQVSYKLFSIKDIMP